MRLLPALLREPLVVFVAVGAVLYGAWVLLAPEPVETIQIDAAALRALEQSQQDLIGRSLTEDERVAVRESLIDDEVLIREAVKRGLHWADGRVRQRLTRIMRGAMTETISDPSVAQLQAYFQDNIERFSAAESVSLEQLIVPWGDRADPEELADALEGLRRGETPEQLGRPEWLGLARRMARATRATLVSGYGAEFADAVEALPTAQWSGPLESLQGVHLVHIEARHGPRVATFEEVERYLRDEWMMQQLRDIQQQRIDEIRARYAIEIIE